MDGEPARVLPHAQGSQVTPGITTWDELGPSLKPNKYTLLNIGKRLGALKKDPWAGIGKVKQKLPKLA